MSDQFAVHNCPKIEICDQRWENLRSTADERLRICDECKKVVVLCKDWDHFNKLEETGFCVAYKCYTQPNSTSEASVVQITVGIPRKRNI